MKKLKIAIVSPFPPSKGTLNEYAYHLVTHLRRKEEVASLVILTDRLPEGETYSIEEDGAPVTFEPCWSFNNLANPLHILKVLKRQKPDVVFFNIHFLSFGDSKVAAALGLMLPLLCRLIGIPSGVLLHNIVESVDLRSAGITRNPILRSLYSMIGTLLTTLLLASNFVAVTISRYVRILEKKYSASNVALVPHGSFTTPAEPDFKLPEGPKKVMAFGKFGTYKKVEEMIEAVELIRDRSGSELEIVIAGTDNPNCKGYLQSVKERYSHVDNITFTGYVEEEDVEGLFRESAVVVFPYTSTTGSSGVLHQAGSYGNACVLPNIGDLKDLIEEEGYRGNYFKPGDVGEMADAIQSIVEHEDLRRQMGRANYDAAVSLPMSDIADWYLLHFQSVVDQSEKTLLDRLSEFTSKRFASLQPLPAR